MPVGGMPAGGYGDGIKLILGAGQERGPAIAPNFQPSFAVEIFLGRFWRQRISARFGDFYYADRSQRPYER